jgi:hypothetical protein
MVHIAIQNIGPDDQDHLAAEDLLANEARRLLHLPEREFWSDISSYLAERRLSVIAAGLNRLLKHPHYRQVAAGLLKRIGLCEF